MCGILRDASSVFENVFLNLNSLHCSLLLFLCLDLSFKTPIRPIMRHEHILSEINSVTPRNSTARNIYTPIVRFLTPSKESE